MPCITQQDAKRLSLYSLEPDDIVFSRVGRVGSCFLVEKEQKSWIISGQMLRIRLPQDTVHHHYLIHALRSKPAQDQITGASVGTTRQSINTQILESLFVVLPPLPEQRRIAAILDAADEAIRAAERVIAKLRQVKAGLLHDLLTLGVNTQGRLRDPQVHPEQFKDSPLGRIPREWEVKKLESCVSTDITYGIVQAGPHIENGIPYIRTGDMSGDKLEIKGLLKTSPTIAASYKRSEVHTGEIVCAIRATVGKVLEVPPELDGANLTQGTARIAPNSNVNGHFLLWVLRSNMLQKQFEMAVKGTTFKEITLGALRLLRLPLPKLAEQTRIAAILDAHDARLRAEEAEVAKLRHVKAGLMEDLLTGQVRCHSEAPFHAAEQPTLAKRG